MPRPKRKQTKPEEPAALMAHVYRSKLRSKAKCRASTLAAAVKFMQSNEERIPREDAAAVSALLTKRLKDALDDPKCSGSMLGTAQIWFNRLARRGAGGGSGAGAPADAGPYPSAELLDRIGRAVIARGLPPLPFPIPEPNP